MPCRRAFLLLALALAPVAAGQTLAWTHGQAFATSIDQVGDCLALLRDGVSPGHPALLIGAPFASDGMVVGRVYVVDASDPTNVLRYHQNAPGDEFGQAVASVPDLDGDGRDDYAVGIPGSYWSATQGGAFRVFSATGAVIMTVGGTVSFLKLGSVLAGVEDVNGDGKGDILAGAPNRSGPGGTLLDPNWGYAALYSGANGALLDEWWGTHDNERLGAALAGVGDLDYDGRGDFAIGAPGRDVGSPLAIVDAGEVDVYSGKTRSLLVSVHGTSFEELGTSLCLLGDRDGDGAPEFAAGGPGYLDDKGRVRIYEGLQATLQASVTGLASSTLKDRFGTALSPAGDLDHDGSDDLLVCASREGLGGNAYVLAISGTDFSTIGKTLFGPEADGFGLDVAGGLDVDGDDWPDAFFGLPLADSYGSDAGKVLGYRWTTVQPNVGFQGPGPTTLAVYGTPLESGGHADLVIHGLQPLAPAWLLASLSSISLPFKGGTIVPNPAAGLVAVLFADAGGAVELLGLPGGGGDFDVYVQALCKASSAPKGWWISNAVKMEFAP